MQEVARGFSLFEIWGDTVSFWGKESKRRMIHAAIQNAIQWDGSSILRKKKKRATTQILLGKEMGTHSSILAWRIPWTKEPGRLQSMGSKESRHDLATKPPPPPPISLNHFFQESWLNLIQQGTRTCAINIRHEWNCSLLSISYCWKFFHSTISHLLQSGTLLACSLVASPCVSAVILYYCTFQGTALKDWKCVF